MKTYFGNYLGIVINSEDPEYRGRVQIFIPHIMPALYDGWNKEGKDIMLECVGDNLPNALTSDIRNRLIKILPWAEAASPIIGSSAPGNLFTNTVQGAIQGAQAGAATGGFMGAITGAVTGGTAAFLQTPTANPVVLDQGNLTNVLAKASGITNNSVDYDGQDWGWCARGTTAIAKAQGLIADTGPSAGGNAKDFAYGGSLFNNSRDNPFLKSGNYSETPAVFQASDITSYKPQIGDQVFSTGGGGNGHAQTFMGYDKNGKEVWYSDNYQNPTQGTSQRSLRPGTGFWTERSDGAKYDNFTVYRLKNEQALNKFRVSLGGLEIVEPNNTIPSEQTANGTPASPNELATPSATTSNSAPIPQSGSMVAGGPGIGTVAGTISGGGTVTPRVSPSNLPQGLQRYAETFNSVGEKYNIDPALLAAISWHETAGGSSSAFRNKNNAMGVSNSQGPISFSSVEASIEAQARSLTRKGGYYEGKNTIAEIGSVYAPIGASNDPRSLNQYWVQGVSKYYTQISGNNANQKLLKGSNTFASTEPSIPNSVNNTDGNGRTPIINTNDMASGLFAQPNPGAMVWVFFREGNPLFPVYFAASYSAAEWKSARRSGSGSTDKPDPDSPVKTNATNMKFSGAGGVHANETIDPNNPLNSKSNLSLFHADGSNITMDNGCDFYYSRCNKRDEVEGDRFSITRGFKEQWVTGDDSISIQGNVIQKIGKMDQEALDAMKFLADFSKEMNKVLMQNS